MFRANLEEGGLTRVQTSGSRGNEHIDRGERARLGGGRHLVLEHDLADILQVRVREHEADVAPDVRQQSIELRVVGSVLADNLAPQGLQRNSDL